MKRIVLIVTVALLVATVFVRPASAHVLATDGDQGAVLHILPDDDPTACVATTYELAFSGSKTFSLQGCDCSISYVLNGTSVDSDQLKPISSATSSNTYTFAKPGVYELNVAGKPKQAGAFSPFSLNYSVRVKGVNAVNAQPFPLTLGIGFGLLVIILLLVAVKADGMLEQKDE